MKNLLKGDVVILFGSKVKLKITEDQNTDKKITGLNAKQKYISFTMKDIVKIIRDGKTIYQLLEE